MARKASRWVAGALALASALVAPVAAMERDLDDLYREQWTTRDGLPHNSINAIAQTPEGYLWFATWEGLVRYNGQSFTVFDRRQIPELRDAALRALHVDAGGRLVAGGARGTLVRQAMDGTWEALPTAPTMVTQIAGDEARTLWIGTESDSVLRLQANTPPRQLPPEISGIGANFGFARDVQGRRWAAHADGLMRVETTHLRPAGAIGLPRGAVTAIAADGPRLFVGTASGVFAADTSLGQVDTPLSFRRIDARLAGISISQLLPDGRGGVWIGTLKDGLMRWTARGLQRLGTGPDRPSSRILALFIDSEQNLWVGSNSGLFRFTDAPFSSVTRQNGLPDDYVRSVLARADGSVLIGTAQGLALRDAAGRVREVGTGTALAGASVLSLADTGAGAVWVGTYDSGAILWDGRRVVRRLDVSNGLPSNEVRAFAIDGAAVWIGTTRGLARWDGATLRRWSTIDGLPADFVIALMLDAKRRLWVGTGLGAVRIEGDRVQALDIGAVEDAEYAFGFAEDRARGHVWVASDRGLLRFDADGQPRGAVDLADGLPFEKIFGLAIDADDRLWATGNRGVLRFDMASLNATADGAAVTLGVERFTEADGMASAQCNGGSQPVITTDREGRQWFATSVGAAQVHPEDLVRHTRNAPPVVIESVLADGLPVSLAGRGPLVLPAGVRRVELRFAGLAFVLPERLRYRHRLVGFDAAWIDRGNATLAEYTALPPGRYVFEVEAAQPSGAWGESRAALVVEVPRAWWQQPLLPVAAALALAGLLAALWRWRLRRLAANERRLLALVQERTLLIEQQKGRLRQQADDAARQAREDALTGISNRRAFDEALGREVSRARRSGAALSIALVDLDHFKSINDRYSHAVGDEVLRRTAAYLQSACRGFDLVARWGGEEFAILLPETALDTALATCERFREGLANLDLGDVAAGLRVTASFGVAQAAPDEERHRLLNRADQALYRAKANGRNRVAR